MGIGAVLSQNVQGEERPITFLSRKLHPTKRKYSTNEREALTMKWAVEALQFYLIINPFTLLTDHAPLQWLHKVKDHNPRVLQWYLSLLPFAFQIQHWKGTANANTDYLSRQFEDDHLDYTMPSGGDVMGTASEPRSLCPPPP